MSKNVKKRIDIMHIYNGTQGSAGLYLDEIYHTLKKQGYNQEIFVSYYYPFDYGNRIFFKKTDLAGGCKESVVRKYKRLLEAFKGYSLCLCYVFQHKPSIIVFSSTLQRQVDAMFLIILRLLKTSKQKIVLTCHDILPNDRNKGFWDKCIMSVADYYITHNVASRNDLVKYYEVDKNRIVNHLFPLMNLNKIIKSSMSVDKIYDFAFIGFISRRKGVSFLIDVWRLFHERYPFAKLLIAGKFLEEGYKSDELISIGITIKNKYLTDEEYVGSIKSSRCIVLPYTAGTNSGVLSTLMSFDVPVICSDIDMFKLNPYVSESCLFRSGDNISLFKVLEKYYLGKCEKLGIDKYREDFDSQVRMAYNKLLNL